MSNRIAIYVRVSLEETDKDNKRFQNPENQLQPLKDFCKAMNYEIVKIYTDRMSGANPARPEFRRMMSDAMARRFSGILVWKLDRFSREGIIPTMAYIKKLKDRGIWLRSLTESWLDTSQEGITDIVLAIMAWASAEERKKISERTKAGIRRLKATGRWHGGRPRKYPKESIDEKEYREEYQKEKRKEKRKEYYQKHPERRKARKFANKKIKIPKGKMCEDCNKELATERHHPDYSKPLEVELLCRKCHKIKT